MLPPRSPEKASLLPSRDKFGSQASIPGDVTAWPDPETRPRVASNGNSHARIRLDSLVKASFFPSAERESSVSSPAPVVRRSIAPALNVLGSTLIRQIFLAARDVRSKSIAFPAGAHENLKYVVHHSP